MRIGIDARFFGAIGKGLGRYTQKLIENLEQIDKTNQYFIFLRKENFDEYRPKNNNFKKVPADFRWYTLSEQFNLPRILNKYDLDLVHFPHFNVPIFYRRKFVITIHDLILIHFPTIRGTTLSPIYYWLKFMAYKTVIKSAVSRAKGIIAVSNFTKSDILDNYKIPEDKIEVTYEAADITNFSSSKNEQEVLDKYGIIKPYILYVGNAYPHKNLEALILAFEKIKKVKKDLRLILVGKEDYFYGRLRNFAENRKINGVNFCGFVPDEDLGTVYKNSRAYVFPSLYEGFGIPPLEAMAHGTPVVSSDHPCMKEILGDSVLYFNGHDTGEIEKSIMAILGNDSLRRELIHKGERRVKLYSWRKMAEKTLKIYRDAIQG
jgi:glycosyltransferase involved in cell wall biosynthesis